AQSRQGTATRLAGRAKRTMVGRGGKPWRFGDVMVAVALPHHSQVVAGAQEPTANIYRLEYGADSPEEEAITKAVRARGTFSDDVRTKGTMAYGLTFPNGFKVAVLDSAGPVTDGDKALAAKL